MASVKDVFGKIKDVFAGGKSPQELGLECVHIYTSTATTVNVDGLSISDLAKVGGIKVEKIITAIAHGLRLLDDYQYAVCVGYRSVYTRLSAQEQLELQNELLKSKQVTMAVSAGLIALSIKPDNVDIAKALSNILYRIADKSLEIESASVPHIDSNEERITAQLMDEIGVHAPESIDIGTTTFRHKLIELSNSDDHLKSILEIR